MKKIVAVVLALVMVLGLATTAFAATAESSVSGLYVKETTQGAQKADATVSYFKAVDNKVTDKGLWKADGNVAYYSVNSWGTVFVAVDTLDQASHVIYTDADCENVYLYLKAADPVYYADGAVFTNFGDVCGQYDEDDTDYDDEKTYYTAFNQLYVGVAAGAVYEKQLMVDGKLVKVDAVNNITKLGHKAVYTFDKTGAIESVKCSVCNAVAVKAGNYAAIPEAVVAAGQIVSGPDAAGAYWYWAGVAAPEATDKVESAETFDAGIAMYVGMSVMAAAGSAVVLKKKD